MRTGKSVFTDAPTPLPAVVGRESLKRGLLAVAVEEGLSGILVRGEKGTAKSTAVRAMADLLPEQPVVADCQYGCPPGDPAVQCDDCRDREEPPAETRSAPLVTLPLGATRDRVVGTLSVEDALAGEVSFEPGVLARANRGVLYVDEVNLLEDHLVDVLLDAAAAGVNRVERDGVSVVHPADFTLVGTMNPEEGDLRPQLRDRFDLCVDVAGSDDLDERVAVLDRVLEGEDRDLRAAFADESAALRERVREASARRPAVPEEFRRDAAELCRDAGVDGHRADVAIARAARAFAALDGRPKVLQTDVEEAAEYALAHRMRSRPFENAADPGDVVDEHFDDEEAEGSEDEVEGSEDDSQREGEDESDAGGPTSDNEGEPGDDDREDETSPEKGGPGETERDAGGRDDAGGQDGGDQTEPQTDRRPSDHAGQGDSSSEADGDGPADDEADDEATPLVPGAARAGVGEATAPDLEAPAVAERAADAETGRAEAAPTPDGRGATVRTEPADATDAVDAASTVRAAASRGRTRPTDDDLRRAVRTVEARTLTVFVADASASMAPAMRAAKGVVMELLREAYAERDEVALLAVGGEDAETLLPPTTSVSLAARHLKELPTADRTPLPAGLDGAAELLAREDPDGALVVVVSDGRANVADGSPTAATRAAARRLGETGATVLVVDAGDRPSRAGVLDVVCEATDARRVPLSALSPETVAEHHSS